MNLKSGAYNTVAPASDELVGVSYDSLKSPPIGFEAFQDEQPPPEEPNTVESGTKCDGETVSIPEEEINFVESTATAITPTSTATTTTFIVDGLLRDLQETKESLRSSQYFDDGIRKIDYILAYEDGKGSHDDSKKPQRRRRFEESLVAQDLQLEYAKKDVSCDGKTNFIKIHAPWHVLCRYAELLNMKMPLAENDMEEIDSCWSKCPNPFALDPDIVKPDLNYFTAPFNRERMEQYYIKDKESFFTNAQRSRIVYEILSRAEFEDQSSDNKKTFGPVPE